MLAIEESQKKDKQEILKKISDLEGFLLLNS
jgi:hypothetical protein